jgi:hypothetical protein
LDGIIGPGNCRGLKEKGETNDCYHFSWFGSFDGGPTAAIDLQDALHLFATEKENIILSSAGIKLIYATYHF